MKNISTLFLFFSLILTLNDSGNAQVSVTGALVGNGSYTTLTAAFTAINGGVQTGANINILISANTNEPGTGATLNNGAWSGILIQPSGNNTITGAINNGRPLIDLNGADHVTIDGLNSGGNSLTISNPNTSSVNGTSTIRFQNDAKNNVLTRCNIFGSSTATALGEGGVISFSGGSSTGNDDNLISYCNIGPAGSNLPFKGVVMSGTTTSLSENNSGDTIRNCNIYDYFRSNGISAGILADVGNNDIFVLNNKFFQTSSRTSISGGEHNAIRMRSNSGTAGTDKGYHTVKGNIIGYSDSSGFGRYELIMTASSRFVPILLAVDSLTASVVQGNIITAISMTGVAAGTTVDAVFRGIYIGRGLANILGNEIGSQSDTSAITYTSGGASTSDLMGIYNAGNSLFNCSENSIGGITASNSNNAACNLFLIRAGMPSYASIVCENNMIGGSPQFSVMSHTTVTTSRINGILVDNSSSTITGNVVRNLRGAGGTGTGAGASVCGINVSASSSNHSISQNNIYALSNSNISAAVHVTGLYYASTSGTNLISRNFIRSLIVSGSSAVINGIVTTIGSSTFQNKYDPAWT